MILPTKHIPARRSLLGLGALLLQRLERPRTVTDLWGEVNEVSELGSFERFSLTLGFLYAIGAVEFEEGLLRRCQR